MIDFKEFIAYALKEDVGSGDHTSLACIPAKAKGKARLMVKEDCILAGVELAEKIFHYISPDIKFTRLLEDGSKASKGDIAFTLYGSERDILKGERLVLNCMQRMSGIATVTNKMVQAISGTKAKLLDTRKTTPGFRALEKWAVKIGGGENHRFGLYDMILIKDNHVDYSGGIPNAILAAKKYLKEHPELGDLKIEVEARNLNELKQIFLTGGIHRILLDNFSIELTRQAVALIGERYQTESSGNITLENIGDYASCGVDYISVGGLTHSYKSIDLSLKAFK